LFGGEPVVGEFIVIFFPDHFPDQLEGAIGDSEP